MKLIFTILVSVVLGYYSQEEGKEYYFYSNIAFCPDEKILNWSCLYPCQNTTGMTQTRIMYNPVSKVRGYVGYQTKTKRIVVAFRGSDTNVNWAADFTFPQIKYRNCENCKVHTGFYLSWESIQLQTFINVLRTMKNSEIYVTGHSFGGAVATFAALELKLQGFNVVGLYTFGSPRVGNKEFADFVDSKIPYRYRVVHDNDLFPALPPKSFGYQHIAQEIWQMNFDGSNVRFCDPNNGEDETCSDSRSIFNLKRSDHGWYYGLYNSCSGE